MIRLTLAVLLAVSTCSCTTSNHSPGSGQVTHVIVVWLKKPGDQAARQRVIDESKKLREIPGVRSVAAGSVIPSARPVVDSSFDVAIVMTLDSKSDLEKYTTHPKHQGLVQNVIRPLVDHYKVYDMEDPGP
jgi:hypothetical protein